MSVDPAESNDPLERLASLDERGKEPRSARVLNSWVSHAQDAAGLEAQRLGWLIASTVVVAALQRALDTDGRSRFLLKGGTYLQHRLNWTGRPTKDVDGLVRGDIDEFLAALDETFREPWGPFTLSRTEVAIIEAPKLVKPRRFHVLVSLRGEVWRRIQVEVSADEAGAGLEDETLRAPDLKHFGIPSPDQLVGIAMRYQIAQKLHACTDPHSPPNHVNDRARDAVDLLLLRDLAASDGSPMLGEIREACLAVFEARVQEADALGRPARNWPPVAVAHSHWSNDYDRAAIQGGVQLSLAETIGEINTWIAAIDAATST